jgi:hypothetical protein
LSNQFRVSRTTKPLLEEPRKGGAEELAEKPSAIVIVSEAKDPALPSLLENAQSEILRFAQDDSFPASFRNL